MIIPKYTYELNGLPCEVVLDKSASVDSNKDTNAVYFRKTLTGKVTFYGATYEGILKSDIDTKLYFTIHRVKRDGSKALEYSGYFTKADCKIDANNRFIQAKINTDDDYEEFLYQYKKEHNVVDIFPEVEQVRYKLRGFYQFYVEGADTITNLLGNNYWLKKVSSTSDHDEIVRCGFHQLVNPGFYGSHKAVIRPLPGGDTSYTGCFVNDLSNNDDDYLYDLPKEYYLQLTPTSGSEIRVEYRRVTDGRLIMSANGVPAGQHRVTFTLTGNTPEGASISREVELSNLRTYARYLTARNGGAGFTEIPDDDFALDNSNYQYSTIYGVYKDYLLTEPIVFHRVANDLQESPSKWGKDPITGKYFAKPTDIVQEGQLLLPLASNLWEGASVWGFIDLDNLAPVELDKDVLLKDAYSLQGVITALLNQTGIGLTFEADTYHSKFLFSDLNPISGEPRAHLFLTQKTNILTSGYSDPARKTPTTLKSILDMLQSVYNCYWVIEEGALKIEHISYFLNGKSYDGPTTDVGFDMTKTYDVRTRIVLDYAQSKYEYKSEQIPLEIKMAYHDESSQLFTGPVIEPQSGFVNRERTESITVTGFTADIDRMLAVPEEASKDGFCIMATFPEGDGTFRVPMGDVSGYLDEDAVVASMQNHLLSFPYLVDKYLSYNTPYLNYIYGKNNKVSNLRSKLMVQEVEFMTEGDIDPNKLVLTGLGGGTIEKISLHLSTRNNKIELRYETK